METGPEMLFVELQARFQMQNSFFVVLLLLANDSQIEESVYHSAIRAVNSALEKTTCLVHISFLLTDSTKPHQSFRHKTVKFD